MLGELEDLAVIDALALEHGAAIMQRMGEKMHPRVTPRDELAVHPDVAVALIVRLSGHAIYKLPSRTMGLPLSPARIEGLIMPPKSPAQELRKRAPQSINAGIKST